MLNSEYINNFLKTKEKKPKENNNTKPHKQNKETKLWRTKARLLKRKGRLITAFPEKKKKIVLVA